MTDIATPAPRLVNSRDVTLTIHQVDDDADITLNGNTPIHVGIIHHGGQPNISKLTLNEGKNTINVKVENGPDVAVFYADLKDNDGKLIYTWAHAPNHHPRYVDGRTFINDTIYLNYTADGGIVLLNQQGQRVFDVEVAYAVTLEITALDDKATVELNGQSITDEKLNAPIRGNQPSLKIDLPLKRGENTLSIKARNGVDSQTAIGSAEFKARLVTDDGETIHSWDIGPTHHPKYVKGNTFLDDTIVIKYFIPEYLHINTEDNKLGTMAENGRIVLKYANPQTSPLYIMEVKGLYQPSGTNNSNTTNDDDDEYVSFRVIGADGKFTTPAMYLLPIGTGKDSRVVLKELSNISQAEMKQATFKIASARAKPKDMSKKGRYVSFQSSTNDMLYLRHNDWYLKVTDATVTSDKFDNDATFFIGTDG